MFTELKNNLNGFKEIVIECWKPLVLLIALFSVVTIEITKPLFTEPKIGDVWRYRPESTNKNPFRKKSILREYYDYKVIDVKDGYVLYMDLLDSTTESSSVTFFLVGAELITGFR